MSWERCSFCGKGRKQVARLIAGPGVTICGECIVLCMDVLDGDQYGRWGPLSEGQLLVRFSDGSAEICEQKLPWRQLVHEGYEFEWCGARARSHVRVLAVRLRGVPRLVIGGKLATDVSLTEGEARRVLDAVGGAVRLRRDVRTERRVIQRGSRPASDQGSAQPKRNGRPLIELDECEIGGDIREAMSREMCEMYVAVPVAVAGTTLIVAMSGTENEASRQELARKTGRDIEVVMASEGAIRRAIERLFAKS